MADSTLLALLTVISMLCAIAMVAFAWNTVKECSELNERTIDALIKIDSSNEATFQLFLKLREDVKKMEKRL